MQFEINTQSKTIKLISSIKTSELKKLKEFIGEDWNNYTIESATTQYIYNNYPWYCGTYTIGAPTFTTVNCATGISTTTNTGTALINYDTTNSTFNCISA